jgi:hypothetical protein
VAQASATDESDRRQFYRPQSEQIARAIHEARERIAATRGYSTRTEAAWEEVPKNVRQLMIDTTEELILGGKIRPGPEL